MKRDPLYGDSSPWVTVRCPYCSTPQRILKAYLPSNVSRAHVARRCEGCGKAWQAVIECTWLFAAQPDTPRKPPPGRANPIRMSGFGVSGLHVQRIEQLGDSHDDDGDEDDYDRARRLRLWRQAQYVRLFFASGCVLIACLMLTFLPPLWWTPGIARNVALGLTLWVLLTLGAVLRSLWRTFRPMWRDA